MSYFLKSIKILTPLLYLVLFGISGIAQNADPYASGVTPQQNNIPVCNSTVVTVTVGNTGANPIAPNSVEWRINFPYDILIMGDLNLPAPFYEFSRVCAPADNEIRLAIRTNAPIGFAGDGVNIGAPQFFLDIPVTAFLPNIQRTITVNVFPLPGFGGQGNVAGNDNASSPIIFSPQACVEYRTVSDGNWNDLSIWEVFNCVVRNEVTCNLGTGGWAPATTIPVQGNSTVLVRNDVTLDVNYTVQNCPLTLDNAMGTTSKLTINPQITLGFNGGTDGNAYFNSRPVVVRSTSAGTGAIGAMLSNSQTSGDDNVTVERYIPDGTSRRWNVLTFGVRGNATIRDAWAGGSRSRVQNSSNRTRYTPALPLGNPGSAALALSGFVGSVKPNNFPVMSMAPFNEPGDYVAGDGTIITGHRYSSASMANASGYDWWPELVIPQGATFFTTPTVSVVSPTLVTTPASIRPYRPSATTDFGSIRGTAWISNDEINTGFGGNGLINMSLSNAYDQFGAFMLFTRGDRRVLENWKSATTLRPTGQIMKQSVSVPVAPGPALTVVGNPYPAPIDFASVYNASNSSVIRPFFYFWNSNLGGTQGHGAWEVIYQVPVETIDPVTGDPITILVWRRSANITPPVGPPSGPGISTAGSNSARVINSSQGFMVEGTATGGSLQFTESMKTGIGNTTNFRPFETEAVSNIQALNANLSYREEETGNLSFVDGINILLGNNFKAEFNDGSDIKKINSHTGTLGLSIKYDENLLMVESHPEPTVEKVFPLFTPGLTERKYSFSFTPEQMDKAGREVFLRDKFLNKLSPISTLEATEYQFEGTKEVASLSDSRFEIVMQNNNVLPVHFTKIHAEEVNKDVKVSWGILTEENMNRYELEHSSDGANFSKAIFVEAKNQSPASYEWLHVKPGVGNHFYRIRAIDNDAKSLLTQIVKVTIGGSQQGGVKIYPTIVSKAMGVNVQMLSLNKGVYQLQVVDMSGKVLSTQSVSHMGGSATVLVNLPGSVSAGQYQIRLFNDKVNYVESVFRTN